MDPLLLDDAAAEPLIGLATQIVHSSGRLAASLHPRARPAVVALVRSMNGYYSNLIEGHRTYPDDIDTALRGNLSPDPKRRDLQLLHIAHVETQVRMEARLAAEPGLPICSWEFLGWLHATLYGHLPEQLRNVEGLSGRRYPVAAGQLRRGPTSVGDHNAPQPERLPSLMQRFASTYGPQVNPDAPRSLLAAAAAHHRLVWVHPFDDGNGRVARLFTQAWFIRAGVDAGGLWTLSRGLARDQTAYRSVLRRADQAPDHAGDGRGPLSRDALAAVSRFLLTTAADQIAFMEEALGVERLEARLVGYARVQEASGALPAGSHRLLRQLLLRGEVSRGEAVEALGVPARTAQRIIGSLLGAGMAESPSPKGVLNFAVPAAAANFYFPQLYPNLIDSRVPGEAPTTPFRLSHREKPGETSAVGNVGKRGVTGRRF